mmetsp:Transcript_4177/g.13576  ORF Transcript_4177/g.13576 Transcript_4177/m.13576 type:complete len:211 (+) Transcript_4177:390-1022(+)
MAAAMSSTTCGGTVLPPFCTMSAANSDAVCDANAPATAKTLPVSSVATTSRHVSGSPTSLATRSACSTRPRFASPLAACAASDGRGLRLRDRGVVVESRPASASLTTMSGRCASEAGESARDFGKDGLDEAGGPGGEGGAGVPSTLRLRFLRPDRALVGPGAATRAACAASPPRSISRRTQSSACCASSTLGPKPGIPLSLLKPRSSLRR